MWLLICLLINCNQIAVEKKFLAIKHVVVLLVSVVVVLSSLPELLEKKRLIDMHTNVATAILEQIKVCALHFYSLV